MNKLIFLFFISFLIAGCRQVYEPSVLKVNNNFLVVDGFINTTPNAVTTINLSRTRTLVDTIGLQGEQNATVTIEGKNGSINVLTEQANGVYSKQLFLNNNDLYRINISTKDGFQYASDFVPVKPSPPIDSLTWNQDKDVSVYVNTHDPSNNSRYYRWDFSETWEYHAAFETSWGVNNGLIFFRGDTSNQIFKCWSTLNSTDIYTGNTLNLSQDVVAHILVDFIHQGSSKIAIRYSVLVNQYVLTKEAYEFWQVLQKNTQKLGSLFDPQPSQLKSNIHCITNPAQPVMGYLSAGSVQSKRIFINNNQLTAWTPTTQAIQVCDTLWVPSTFPYYNYPDTSYAPYYFISNGPMVVIPTPCLDCRRYGGTTVKPSFW